MVDRNLDSKFYSFESSVNDIPVKAEANLVRAVEALDAGEEKDAAIALRKAADSIDPTGSSTNSSDYKNWTGRNNSLDSLVIDTELSSEEVKSIF